METQLSMLWSAKSDTGVPGIAVFGGCGAETFAEPLQVMRNGEAGDVFNALLAELAGDTPFDAGEDFGGSAGKLALGRRDSIQLRTFPEPVGVVNHCGGGVSR
jgi:hypothetical protein